MEVKQTVFQEQVDRIRKLAEMYDRVFEEGVILSIKGFSYYIANTNNEFHYNGTYLEDNIEDYCIFLNKFKIKDKAFKTISKEISTLMKELDVEFSLIIDELWMIEYREGKTTFLICKEGNLRNVNNNNLYCKFQMGKENPLVCYRNIKFDCQEDIENRLLEQIKIIKIRYCEIKYRKEILNEQQDVV